MTQEFISLTIVFFLGLVSPGPDFIITVRQSLLHNYKQAIATAIGISIGLMVHVGYCILGLSVIIANSVMLFNAIKYCGAFYLIYLGVKAVRSNGSNLAKQINTTNVQYNSIFSNIRLGFVTNLLNPKATFFIISIFALVVKQDTALSTKLLYAIWMFTVSAGWFSFVAVCFVNKYVKNFFLKFNKYIDNTLGVVLIAFGVKLALWHK